MDDDTEVEVSCTATLNDEMWVFGGYYKPWQVNFKWTNNQVDIENFWKITFRIKRFSDEQGEH